MILRRITEHVKAQNWTAVGLDFVIVVVGVFIGIQVANWNTARAERVAESRYIVRLYTDTRANIAELEGLINLHQQRAAVLVDLEDALLNGGEAPSAAALDGTLCRFFVQPGAALQQETYNELVSSGALSILRDEKLRILLSRQQAAQIEAARLDILTPAIQRAAIPLEGYRVWTIAREQDRKAKYGGVNCTFDVDGMRADPRIPSMIAQLYRDQDIVERFRKGILEITLEINARLRELIEARRILIEENPSP